MNIHYAPAYFMEPLHPITVMVIGVGGNGTQVLTDLAKINSSLLALGHPGLFVQAVDDDIVEQPNIGRQKFSEADLGTYKASALITRLNRFYGTNWVSIPEKFKRRVGLINVNIVITCVDNVKTRKEVQDAFISAKRTQPYQIPYYWLDFGNGKDFGQFILGSTEIEQPNGKHETISKLKNVIDLFPNMEENEELNSPSCSTYEALQKQDLFINSILVTSGMSLIWRLLKDFVITHHGGYINTETCTTRPMKI